MRDSFLSFSPPDLGDEEIAEVVDCLRSGWITTGPRANSFEQAFANYVGTDAAVVLSSGTAALHVAMLACNVSAGQAVVVPAMTFASGAHVVEHAGAVPLLVDVESETLNIDPIAVDRAIKTSEVPVRCVAPVHLHGQPCDLPALLDLAGSHDIPIVDDAAHALPARIGTELVGGSRDRRVLTAFSFYATKNLTTAEGGMLTGPKELVREAERWILHGMTKDAHNRYQEGGSWRYDVDRAGFKYNMSDIQAALGLVQLRRLPVMHARRKAIAERYAAALADQDAVQLPLQRSGTDHAWHIYAIRLHLDRLTISRDHFIDELRRRRVGTSVHFIPIHLLSYYRDKYGFRPEGFPVASREFERLISLPIHSRMTDSDVDDVIEAVADVARANRR